MNPKEDIVFDVTCFLPDRVKHEQVRFVNISYEKIQEAMVEAFNISRVEETEDAEMFLRQLARSLNKKNNTIEWRGKVMKMNFFVDNI
jgi:hypothetical protein